MRKKRIAQDDIRERYVCNLLGIMQSEESPFAGLTKKREGIDAFDDAGNPFEIKGTSKDRNDNCFSTARDVTVAKVDKWRKQYWVFAIGDNYQNEYDCKELFIFHPSQLEFFFSSVQRQIEYLESQIRRLIDYAKAGPFGAAEIKFFEKKLQKSTTVNDPRVRVAWVRKLGTPLDPKESDKAQNELSLFLAKYPLDVRFETKISKEVDIFDLAS